MPYQIYDPTDQMWYTGPDGVGRGGHGWSATRDAAVTYATLQEAQRVRGDPFLSWGRALQVLHHIENPPAATRKVVSVTSDIGRLIAVDADGIMWVLERCADEWTLLPQLPRMLINQPGA